MQTLLNPTRNMDHYRDPFHISRIILDFIGLLQNLDKKNVVANDVSINSVPYIKLRFAKGSKNMLSVSCTWHYSFAWTAWNNIV